MQLEELFLKQKTKSSNTPNQHSADKQITLSLSQSRDFCSWEGSKNTTTTTTWHVSSARWGLRSVPQSPGAGKYSSSQILAIALPSEKKQESLPSLPISPYSHGSELAQAHPAAGQTTCSNWIPEFQGTGGPSGFEDSLQKSFGDRKVKPEGRGRGGKLQAIPFSQRHQI